MTASFSEHASSIEAPSRIVSILVFIVRSVFGLYGEVISHSDDVFEVSFAAHLEFLGLLGDVIVAVEVGGELVEEVQVVVFGGSVFDSNRGSYHSYVVTFEVVCCSHVGIFVIDVSCDGFGVECVLDFHRQIGFYWFARYVVLDVES